MQCFTGNYSGGHLGGRAVDEIREFDNKHVKESLRRTHRSEGDLAPELELTERHYMLNQVLSSAFHCLDSSSGGAIPALPDCATVASLALRKQWPSMLDPVDLKCAAKQTSFFDDAAHLVALKETLGSLFRGEQFE